MENYRCDIICEIQNEFRNRRSTDYRKCAFPDNVYTFSRSYVLLRQYQSEINDGFFFIPYIKKKNKNNSIYFR